MNGNKLNTRLFSLARLSVGPWLLAGWLFFNHPLAAQINASAANQPATDSSAGNLIPTDSYTIQRGRDLFNNQCLICHHVDKQLIGPALASVTKRRPLPWLIDFIHNSQQVIKGGDEYANFLYDSFHKTVMPSFEFLSENDIKAILGYIQSESEVSPAIAGVNGQVSNAERSGPGAPISDRDISKGANEQAIKEQQAFFDGISTVIKVFIGVTLGILVVLVARIFKALN
jgi:mono/diheme cytochrome c family protein